MENIVQETPCATRAHDTMQPNIIGYFVINGRKPEAAPDELLTAPPACRKYGEVFEDGILVVQMENDAIAEKVETILKDRDIHHRAVADKDHMRFFFQGEYDAPYTFSAILCGTKAEVVSNYGYLEHLEGQITIVHEDDCPYDELPQWLYPAKNEDVEALISTKSLIGEKTWIEFLQQIYDRLSGCSYLQNQRAYEKMLEAAEILNDNFRLHPFETQRMKNALDIMEFQKPDFSVQYMDEEGRTRTKFSRDKFAEWFIARHGLKNIDGLPYAYTNGIYIYKDHSDIEMLFLRYITDSSQNMRKEIRNTIFSILGVYGSKAVSDFDGIFNVEHPASPNLIAFKNGILNIETGEMQPFSKDIILTSRVPYVYKDYGKLIAAGKKTKAMELVDDWLDSFSGNDKSKRLVVEECAGLSCYRRNAGLRRHHTLFVGPKESGKSTMIRMIESLFGENDSQVSHVSLEDLANTNNRFSAILLVGCMLNTYADISSHAIWDATRVKNITCGDSITVEQKNCPAFDFTFEGKLVYGANVLPRIDDEAVSSRFEFIPCNGDFNSRGTACNANLYEQLHTESCMNYWVYLAIKGLKRFIDNGYKHTYCEENEQLRRTFESVANPVRSFVDAVGSGSIINRNTQNVYEEYLEYIVKTLKLPESRCHPSKNQFTSNLKRMGYDTMRKSVEGNKITVYIKAA